MLIEKKKRTSRKWRGALIYLALIGAAPVAWGTLQADETATSNPVVGSNNVGFYSILKDTEIDVQALETEGVWQWFSVLSGNMIVNKGDNSLTFTLTTDNPDKGLFFASDMTLNSGWLTLKPTVLADSSQQINNISYSGTTSGVGGLRLDVGDGAVFYVNGELGHAHTDVKTGTLDVSRSYASQVDLGGLSSEGAGVVYAGTKDLIVDFDGESLAYNGTLIGSGAGATLIKKGSGTWTLNLKEGSKVGSVQVQKGVFSLGENHYDSGSVDADFEIILEKNGVFKLDTENDATLTLNNLNASKGGTIQIGAKNALVLSDANKSTEIVADLRGEGRLALKNVLDDSGVVAPWILSGNNSNWSGTISLCDANAEITLASAKSSSANTTIAFESQGNLKIEKSLIVGSLALNDSASINIASGKTLTLGALTSNYDGSLGDYVTTIKGGGVLSLNESAVKDYHGAMLVKDGSGLLVRCEGVSDVATGTLDEFAKNEGAENEFVENEDVQNEFAENEGAENEFVENEGGDKARRGITTLTEGGVLALDYSGVAFENETGSIWGSDLVIDGDGEIIVMSKGTNGAIVLDENIAFVDEEANNLTVLTEGALVRLQSKFEGKGALIKKGDGTLILDGSGSLVNATVSKGVLQIGTEGKVNSQLENADVFVNGGSLTGWSEKLGSLSLSSGVVMLTGPRGVGLTNSGSAFTMSGGTVYVGVVDEENYSKFIVNNDDATVEIKGGAFYVDTATNGVELSEGARLDVVESAAGNIAANVSKITIYDDIAHKRFVVDSDALHEGKFSLVLKDSNFSEYARTANQKNAASYADKFLDSSCEQSVSNFFSALENSAAVNSSALDQTTGELRFSAMNAQMQTRNLIRQTLTRAVLPSATVAGIDASAIRGQSDDDVGFAGWMNVLGAFGDVNDHSGASGYDYTMLGGIWGVELGSSTTNQMGLYYSYNNSQANTKSALGKAKIDDNIFGVYLRVSDSWGYSLATGSLGTASYKFDRYTSLQNYERQYFNGKTSGWSGDVGLERGFTFDLSSVQLQPFAGLQYTHLQADAFTESGTLRPVALRTDKTSYDSMQGTLGIRLLQSVQIAVNDLDWNAYVGWTHEYLDANAKGAVAMIGAPDGKIRVVGNGAGRDWVYIGAGGTYELNDSFDIFAGSDLQLNEYVALVNGNAGFRYRW